MTVLLNESSIHPPTSPPSNNSDSLPSDGAVPCQLWSRSSHPIPPRSLPLLLPFHLPTNHLPPCPLSRTNIIALSYAAPSPPCCASVTGLSSFKARAQSGETVSPALPLVRNCNRCRRWEPAGRGGERRGPSSAWRWMEIERFSCVRWPGRNLQMRWTRSSASEGDWLVGPYCASRILAPGGRW